MSSDDKPYSVETREGYFTQFAELLNPHLKFSRIVITGGFRTAQGMANAVSQGATDSKSSRRYSNLHILLSGWHDAVIGLARPLTAEPLLIGDMLRGEKKKVKDDKLPDSPLLRVRMVVHFLSVHSLTFKCTVHSIRRADRRDWKWPRYHRF